MLWGFLGVVSGVSRSCFVGVTGGCSEDLWELFWGILGGCFRVSGCFGDFWGLFQGSLGSGRCCFHTTLPPLSPQRAAALTHPVTRRCCLCNPPRTEGTGSTSIAVPALPWAVTQTEVMSLNRNKTWTEKQPRQKSVGFVCSPG